MIIGKVIGTVWATRKEERLGGNKLLIVKRVDPTDPKMSLPTFVAADIIGAGVGEMVLVVEGSSARRALAVQEEAPVDATVVGIIDDLDLNGA